MLLPSLFNDTFATDFDEMFQSPFWGRNLSYENRMHSDIKELSNGYELKMELPGFCKDDIHAELKDGYMTIRAEHSDKKEEKDEDGKYIRRECCSGSCQRSFYVGEAIKEEDIKAGFKDGILNVFIPKKEEIPKAEEKKYISIEG